MAERVSRSSRGPVRGAIALACVLLAMGRSVTGLASPKDLDRVWAHPDLPRLTPARVAVLPAVAVEGGLDICPFVEKRWAWAAAGSRMKWLPTPLVRTLLERAGHDTLLTRVGREVLKSGRVDSTTAPKVAGALGTRGLLSLRVDLWRREDSPVRGRTRAVVGLTASLVDSSGRLLWTATGREEHEVGSVSRFTEEFGQAPADYDSALTGLASRWGSNLSVAATPAPAAPGP